MIVSFVFPSSHHRTGGVTMLYEFANALARRDHEVHFMHGPLWEARITSLSEVPFAFEPRVEHHIVDDLNDPALPRADVVFGGNATRDLGAPAVIVQGYRLLGREFDALAYRSRGPKVCVASWLVEVGRYYGVPEHQLAYVPLGLDHELFAMRRPQTERTIDVAILYHPAPEKGWDVGRAMLAELMTRRPELHATVITLAQPPREPLPDGVELVSLSQRDLAEKVYNEARVFVQASHHEGFGLTALEAMACGAALVTTDCGGSRDYALPNVNSLVVPAGNPRSLVDCAEQLLDDETTRISLAQHGAASVAKFDWDRSGLLLEEILERYIAHPASFQQPPGEDRSAAFAL